MKRNDDRKSHREGSKWRGWTPGYDKREWPGPWDWHDLGDSRDARYWHNSHEMRDWQKWAYLQPKKKRFLFFRFLLFFIPMVGIFIAGIMFILRGLTGQLQDVVPNPRLIMFLIWGVPILLGLGMAIIAGLAFRKFASPMADLMAALDEVAEGNFSVRVAENMHGEFGKMSHSFNRMAEQLATAEENRRNLTADVAHELRTPLHIIQGNLEGMLDGVYESTAEQIGVTLDETRLLARLVNDLQTLSLAEAGKLHLNLTLISAADLVNDTVTSFFGMAAEQGITLKSEIAGDEAALTITADEDRLSQVLNNLVANAVRYTPAGGHINIRVEAVPDVVRITVRDTGQGIDPLDLPYVFDRFWKAERSRSRHEGSGSGLGLAIARQLVQSHGGTIRVDSRQGEGTSFIIDLPVMPPEG